MHAGGDSMMTMNWNPESYLMWGVAISAVPILVAVGTCYLKFSIVLSLLKSGFGTQQAPSAALTMALSLVMSLVVMESVITETYSKAAAMKASDLATANVGKVFSRLIEVLGPWRNFLLAHAGERELAVFSRLGKGRTAVEDVPVKREELAIPVILGAFVVSEIKAGFLIALFLLLPFFVIDLIVANILVGMGLTMMSPVIVSLPLKLMLFISADGWLLLAQSLIRAYQ
jgi:flagellar biosynthesis protein FliP